LTRINNKIKIILIFYIITRKYRNITISEEIYYRLKELGRTADSFNDVIKKLLIKKGEIKSEYEK
jgi:predicted CopG family antitoxin